MRSGNFSLLFNFFLITVISSLFFIFFSCSITSIFSVLITNPMYFGYSDPAMLLFSSLLEFHNDVMFFLCQIILLVFFILFYTFFYITRFSSFSFLNSYFVLYLFVVLVVLAFYSFFLSNFFINSLEKSFFFYNFDLTFFIVLAFVLSFGLISVVFLGNYFFNADSAFEPVFFLSLETLVLSFFYGFSNQNLGFESDSSVVKKTLVYQTKKPVVFELVLETLWTIFPSLILLIISISSFTILYGLDDQTVMNDASYDNFYLKTIGRQWYWSYEVESTPVVDSLVKEANSWAALYSFEQDLLSFKQLVNSFQAWAVKEDILHQADVSGHLFNSYTLFINSAEELAATILLQNAGVVFDSVNSIDNLLSQTQLLLNDSVTLSQENFRSVFDGVTAYLPDDKSSSTTKISDAAMAIFNILAHDTIFMLETYDSIINQLFNLSTELSNLSQNSLSPNILSTSFDSYMVSNDDFLIIVGNSAESLYFDSINRFRLLETDTVVQIPLYTLVRLFVTSTDVLHSWTVPAFGLKIDACPGRLNQGWLFLDREGVFYGQCSELCGLNHGFMPIVISVNSL